MCCLCSESSEEEKESDYELDYEILSAGSAEPWDDTEEGWVSASGPGESSSVAGSAAENVSSTECNGENGIRHDEKGHQASKLETASSARTTDISGPEAGDSNEAPELAEDGTDFDFEDLEQLMSEIGNIRDNLRFMPDFQRREMAAKLTMKMASMFGGGSDEEE